jgi:AcrR family transcriptional regulator
LFANLRAERTSMPGRPHAPAGGRPMPPTPEPSPVSADAVPGRRARIRQQTEQDLKAAALAELRERGGVGLSLRSVARRMDMSPAGLYRYVDSREGLLTWLIADGFDDLADALEDADEAAGRDVRDRLRAVALAYREWGVAHPNEFGLLFGDPIPGYAAPDGGPTVDAMRRVGAAFAGPFLAAIAEGRLRIPAAYDVEELAGPLAPMSNLGQELPTPVSVLFLLAWGRLHGQTSLEVFGQHHWLFPDGCERLYRAEVEAVLDELVLPLDGSGRVVGSPSSGGASR